MGTHPSHEDALGYQSESAIYQNAKKIAFNWTKCFINFHLMFVILTLSIKIPAIFKCILIPCFSSWANNMSTALKYAMNRYIIESINVLCLCNFLLPINNVQMKSYSLLILQLINIDFIVTHIRPCHLKRRSGFQDKPCPIVSYQLHENIIIQNHYNKYNNSFANKRVWPTSLFDSWTFIRWWIHIRSGGKRSFLDSIAQCRKI